MSHDRLHQQDHVGETEKGQLKSTARRDAPVRKARVLPADVYDALELSALVAGGIGGRSWAIGGVPCCLVGHAMFVAGVDFGCYNSYNNPVAAKAKWLKWAEDENDAAVQAINERRGKDIGERVSFADLCAELHIVRGRS